MAADHLDVRTWCERAGLDGVRSVRPITTGASGAVVAAVDTAVGAAVLKVTTDPSRLERARREVDLLHHLDEQSLHLAPPVLGSAVTDIGVAVVLAQCTPLPAAERLSGDDWEQLALLVAAVHLAAPPPWLDGRGPRAGALPSVLEHGDCHLANAVRDASGRSLLVDWQEARLADGLSDLVFLWQRAEFAGSQPPREAMTSSYADARGLDPDVIAPLLDATELRLLREAWPPFLPMGSDAGRATLARRLAELTATQDGLRSPER